MQRPDGSWYALDTRRLLQHVAAAGTLCTPTMTSEVCEELRLATVPREVTPGLRPVMEIAGVDRVPRPAARRWARTWSWRAAVMSWVRPGRAVEIQIRWPFSSVMARKCRP
ncbi:hypothetical protein ACIODT_38560 [Streptomyces sp. NPDC088251]|uniref:hypothetical protein n=1 Tax=unclassified Streptomyces TaxID=2593676 RepID=UPI003823EE0F